MDERSLPSNRDGTVIFGPLETRGGCRLHSSLEGDTVFAKESAFLVDETWNFISYSAVVVFSLVLLCFLESRRDSWIEFGFALLSHWESCFLLVTFYLDKKELDVGCNSVYWIK